MTTTTSASVENELVPLGERLRYMQLFRLAVVVVVGLVSVLLPESRTTGLANIVLATSAYVVVAVVAEVIWRVLKRRALGLFGMTLMVDGLYLAWVSYDTGGSLSPLRYLILLHLIAVALLASYRTGLKLALWHSLLVFTSYDLQQAGALPRVEVAASGSEYRRLALFIVVFWLVTLATTTFSAINERELRRRRFDLEALARMATELEGATESGAVADVLLDSIVDTFGYERALLVGAPDGEFSLMGSRGLPSALAASHRPSTGSIIDRARQEKRTVLVSELDPSTDAWLAEAFPSSRNLVVAPLYAEGRSIGVLVMEHAFRNGSRIERRVVSAVERFVSHAALALRNAWLLEQVQRMADTDGLTGIRNRRSFDDALGRELARSSRSGEPVSVLLVDIDHFKRLNDTHGHQCGDEVLRQVASTIASVTRDIDTVARYGGEEFAVILPTCPSYDALQMAERIRCAVQGADTMVPVTVSGGFATFPIDGADAAAVVGAADAALYESKRSGRNRVTAAVVGLTMDPAGRGALRPLPQSGAVA